MDSGPHNSDPVVRTGHDAARASGDLPAARTSPSGPDRAAFLEAVLEHMVQGVMVVDADHIVQVCNAAAMALLDLPRDLMARRPHFVDVLEHQWSTDEFSATPDEIKAFVRAGGILDQPQIYERSRPNGTVIEVQSTPLAAGGVLRIYIDVTERRRNDERIRHRARHDGLTALLNREAFIEQLSESINEAAFGGVPFAVHYLDLDDFKPVNDARGHQIGDKVLALMADRLRHVAREGDFVARIGGDEFAILQCAVTHADQAVGLAQRLLDILDTPFPVEGEEVKIGVSCGVALFPQHGVTPDQLLRHADAALYAVKADGGHGVSVYAGAPPPR